VACGGRPWCSLAGGRWVQLSVVSVSAPRRPRAYCWICGLTDRAKTTQPRGRQWSPERRIRAQVPFHLLTGCGPGLTDGVVAMRVRGAQIVGRLNLGGWKLRCTIGYGYRPMLALI
jgi:hypothetical protein